MQFELRLGPAMGQSVCEPHLDNIRDMLVLEFSPHTTTISLLHTVSWYLIDAHCMPMRADSWSCAAIAAIRDGCTVYHMEYGHWRLVQQEALEEELSLL